VPPRRPRGRHRRPKNTGAPAYLTAATVAAFAVSGVNVPNAIGDSGETDRTTPVAYTLDPDAVRQPAVTAVELRKRIAAQEAERVSRIREKKVAARAARIKARKVARERAAAAREAARPKWVAPVSGYRLSAGFGESSYLWSTVHTGQDFAAPYGTAVRSVGDGTIVFAGWDGSYGNKIAVQHPDGTVTWYAHMSALVRTGGTVEAGDVIGAVGSTGNSTGNHLHLEVRPGDGDPIEPMGWLRGHGVRV
jgi:murein DD-endopeptidase MepM/ murein hydrolase activator NlpD